MVAPTPNGAPNAVCSHRGLFTIGPTSLTTGDPFGIFTLQIQDPASRLVMVVPPIVPLPAIEVAPGGRSGSGRPRQNAPERTVSASTVRQYVPGDNLHSIHWKTTARRDSLFVRIFDGTPTSDWRIILDLDQAVQAGAGLGFDRRTWCRAGGLPGRPRAAHAPLGWIGGQRQ